MFSRLSVYVCVMVGKWKPYDLIEPCCNIEPTLVTVTVPIDGNVTMDVQEALEKIMTEEQILMIFKTDEIIVKISLERVTEIKIVHTDVLSKQNRENILIYSSEIFNKKLCQRILKTEVLQS